MEERVSRDINTPGEGSDSRARAPSKDRVGQPAVRINLMKPTWESLRGYLTRKEVALVGPAGIGPKALGALKVRPVVGALMAIGLALVLYRSQRDVGFAILAVLGGAAGWLLLGRVAGLISLGEVIALAGCLWLGIVPWPTGLVQIAIVITLTGLAHLAAERELSARRNAANERRLDGLTFLLETAESLAGAPDRDVILNTAVRASARGVSRSGSNRSAHAAFHEVIGEQIKIAVVADEAPEREIATGFEYPMARNQAARAAIRTGGPALVRPDHLSGPLRELADRLGWQVLIMAPVYRAGSLQGLLAASARDGPAVDELQQYMLGALARLTSSSLDSAADKHDLLLAAARNGADEVAGPGLLPGVVDELRDAVKPIKDHMLELSAPKNDSRNGSQDVVHAFGKLDDLISTLASRTAIDVTTGLPSREFGLAALERDVLRARRTLLGRHCLAVVRVASSEPANGTELIRVVADRLRLRLRREDLIFRYAEVELVCSFADMDTTDAWPILNGINTELAGELGYTPFAIGLTSLSPGQPADALPHRGSALRETGLA
jgi:GGDEF domain-containing protein